MMRITVFLLQLITLICMIVFGDATYRTINSGIEIPRVVRICGEKNNGVLISKAHIKWWKIELEAQGCPSYNYREEPVDVSHVFVYSTRVITGE
jgi:hypothetical protein